MAANVRTLCAEALVAAGIATPLAAPFVWRFSPALALGAMAASHAPLLYGTLRANAQLFGPVVTRFVPQGKEVWLTIDDGPHPEDTPEILELLDAAGARATFFVRGDRARAYPELIVEMLRRGHQVGNHTYSHPQAAFWCLPPGRIRHEIAACNQVLRELAGHSPQFFRAPVGMVNPFVQPAARANGLSLLGWSARGYDGGGAISKVRPIIKRIMAGLQPGAIILLHEGVVSPEGEAINVRVVKRLLLTLGDAGWKCVLPGLGQLRCR